MVTWTVTIPTFYAVTLHLLRSGQIPAPERVRSVSATLMGWVPLLAALSYAAIALISQLRLDWIGTL